MISNNQSSPLNEGKQRILDAAEKEFAEKGYGETRIDGIARRAGVNKAHIYYYFNGKEDLFNELIQMNLKKLEEIVVGLFAGTDVFNLESYEEMMDEALRFFQSKGDIVKITIVEAMKGNVDHSYLFSLFDPLFKAITSRVRNLGIVTHDKPEESLVEYFFLDIIPLLIYVTLGKKFASHYDIDPEHLERHFGAIYKKLSLRYFERIKSLMATNDTNSTQKSKPTGGENVNR